MKKVRALATVYMPSTQKGVKVERYEDTEGEDVYEIPNARLEEFLATGNFVEVQ